MSSIKSPHGAPTTTIAYEDFQGLDSTRDNTALDTRKKQHLAILSDGFCDWRGQIVRAPGATKAHGGGLVTHINFYSRDGICWSEQDGAQINLKADNGQSQAAYTINTVVSTTVFNRSVHFFSEGQQSWYFDGNTFRLNQSEALDRLRPAFGMAVSRRMAVAGIPGRETEVHLCRVDDHEIFPDDESNTSTSVLRAAKIDIANFIGRGEDVTALARFEQNKLAIFTADRAILFTIDPDISLWTLDERANINVGCISHNTVAMAGEDVLFCSRSGVHSLSRSTDNGITIVSQSLADKVDILYRALLRSCPDPSSISAVYDPDMGQYHVFFPQPGGLRCKRLTMTIKPGMMDPKWSTSEFLNARAGAFQGGRLFYGTTGGVYEVGDIEDDDDVETPDLSFTTPMLWHGSFTDTKSTHSLIIHAAGQGTCVLEAISDEGKVIASDTFRIDPGADDGSFIGVPLSRQYERKFEHRYRGVQLRFTVSGSGLLRIVGFAVVVRKD